MARIAGSTAAATRVGVGLDSTPLGLAAGRPRSGLEPDISARRACASMRGDMVARTDGSSGSAAALAARRREEPPPEAHTQEGTGDPQGGGGDAVLASAPGLHSDG